MMDCSNHSKEVMGVSDMKALAELIGDLHYETLHSFLDQLAIKLHNDGCDDFAAGRKKLGLALQNTSLYIQKSRLYSKEAWDISKVYMEEAEILEVIDVTNPVQCFNKLYADAFPPTDGPTVYAVFVRNQMYHAGANHLLYIGSSLKPEKRRNSTRHPYRFCYDRFPEHLVFFKCYQFDDYLEVERTLIKHYKPLLNKQGI